MRPDHTGGHASYTMSWQVLLVVGHPQLSFHGTFTFPLPLPLPGEPQEERMGMVSSELLGGEMSITVLHGHLHFLSSSSSHYQMNHRSNIQE